MLLFRSFHPAESDQRLAAGFFHRHAALQVFFNSEIEMSGHLSIKIAIQRLLSEKSAQAVQRLTK